MKRELASMTIKEILTWEQGQREDITLAYKAGSITVEMHRELQQWVTEECLEWNRAFSLGLIKGV